MSGIACLVFSKDREMQLDAFLRSAKRYAPYESVDVTYLSGLELEMAVHGFLQAHDRVVFHTDDDVFFRSFAADGIFGLTFDGVNRPPSTFTLRLGQNTIYCHPLDWEQEPPECDSDYAFNWKWREAQGDFGYPLC